MSNLEKPPTETEIAALLHMQVPANRDVLRRLIYQRDRLLTGNTVQFKDLPVGAEFSVPDVWRKMNGAMAQQPSNGCYNVVCKRFSLLERVTLT